MWIELNRPIRPRLIEAVSDADTVEAAVPSEPEREDAPFVVVRNTIIVVNDKSGTRRIVRGTQKGATQGGRIQTVTGLNP